MKKLILLTIVVVFGTTYTIAQNTITVLPGTNPTIDGIISPEEWNDATIFTYQVGSSPNIITVTVYIKHNGSDTLYIAQNMPNTLSGDRDLVMFDKNNNGGALPQADDFIMNKYHYPVGAPLLEGQANGSTWDWGNPSGWIVALTGYDYNNNQGQIEFAVSFSKLGITSVIQKTIGFGIIFGDYQNPYDPSTIWGWPTNCHPEIPNSWGDMIISFSTDINEIVNNNEIIFFPNPATDKIEISSTQNASIEIINTQGQIIICKNLKNTQATIDLTKLLSGIYFIKVKTDKGITLKKLIKQ